MTCWTTQRNKLMLKAPQCLTYELERRKYLTLKTLHTAAVKCKISAVHPSIHTSVEEHTFKTLSLSWKKKRFSSVFLLQTPKISQQSSHLQNAFQPFSEHAFISDWGAQATLATSGKRWSFGAWIWMLSGVKEWGSVMQCCLWHILCSAPCSNHTPDVPGLLLLSLNLRPTESASSRNLGPYSAALIEEDTKEPSSVWASKSYRGPLLN